MDDFKAPFDIPQDLLLIQDLVADYRPPRPSATSVVAKLQSTDPDYDIDSSSDEDGDGNDSENEVMNLVLEADRHPPSSMRLLSSFIPSENSSNDSSSESSDSDSEGEEEDTRVPNEIPGLDIDAEIDEDDQGTSTKVVPKTAHELEDGDERILVPDADIISSHESLERVGEIMSVQPRAVIVRGTSSSIIGNRALDAETLLVFEDRTVLGYIHETFGPTLQPFYVVKFRSSHPPLIGTSVQPSDKVSLDDALGGNENSVSAPPTASRFIVARPVFHAPNLSRFVFVSELARQKGTDASNAHDEEPTSVDAMDFSDDEEEARWKRSLKGDKGTGDKRKRGESAPYSREQTPAQMYDQQMTNTTVYPDSETLYGSNPYDAHGVYDSDTVPGTGPSTERSVVAYDDPYTDDYIVPALAGPDTLPFNGKPVGTNHSEAHQATSTPFQGHARGRGRGRGRGAGAGSFERGRGRGRGRGGGQQQRAMGRGRDSVGLPNAGRGGWSQTGNHASHYGVSEQYDPHSSLANSDPASALGRQQRELSPTSFAIARATGQHVGGTSFQPLPWQLAMQMEALGQQSHGQIQPHINPRFAAQWGMQIQTQWPSHYSQGQWSQWDQQQYGNSDRSSSDYNQ